MEADNTHAYLKDSINFRNDNLLHYACAKNNLRLAEYILLKNPKLSSLRNNLQELPSDLTNDQQIKVLCMKSMR